jgi:SPP1 family predicted phage head-tail adaptor
MLSADDLAAMRAIQGEALPDTATRTRKALVPDGMGGHTETPSTETYACRIAPTSGRELEVAARVTSAVTFTVTLPYDADVVASDELTVNGRTFQIVAVLRGEAWQTALRVLAVEVT